jgi:hypothetical protein
MFAPRSCTATSSLGRKSNYGRPSEIVRAAAPATSAKKNHFVPQMYLRGFADPASKQGELWRYGPGFKPQLKAPKGIAWQDYFYDVADELPPDDQLPDRGKPASLPAIRSRAQS